MIRPLLLCALLALSASRWSEASLVKLDPDGGYTGLVVKIVEGEVSDNECPRILRNIKKLLDSSSLMLYETFSQQVYFKSVSVVIPASWRDGKCQEAVQPPVGDTPYRKADVLITGNQHPVHGNAPSTQQSRGCGQPGDVLSVPYSFLTRWNSTWDEWGDPAKVFIHEWAKLRYGIFDELGYTKDPIYPISFMANGRSYPTGTSDLPVSGIWVDHEGNPGCDPQNKRTEECFFRPIGSNDEVTCSLGYMPYLPNVNSYCPTITNGHGYVAPTKHNVLCSGRSSLDVIQSHQDFRSRRTYETANLKLKPSITLIREPEPRYVLIMETTSSLDAHGQWKWINKAAQKFIRYDLPLNSNLAVVTFSNVSRVAHGMVQIYSDGLRAKLADTIPDKYHLAHISPETPRSIFGGIKTAIHEVLRTNMDGAHLILVTSGSTQTLSISDEHAIEELIKYYHIKVSSVLIPEGDKLPLAFYDSIAQQSGGSSSIITGVRDRTVTTYMELIGAFGKLLEDREGIPKVIQQDLVEMSEFTATAGSFTVDKTLGRGTRFGVYVEDEYDHLIRSVTFTDPEGSHYGPYTSMSSVYDIINLKTINFPAVGGAPPFDEATLLGRPWTYSIEWGRSGENRQKSAVVITSKPKSKERDIKVKIWTSSSLDSSRQSHSQRSKSSKLVQSAHPLVVYVQVSLEEWGKSPSPVLEAKVDVEVFVSSPDGSSRKSLTLEMRDNGNGDPDLTRDDGIYSRYLTEYPSPGRYEFSVTVTDNGATAYTMTTSESRRINVNRSRRALSTTPERAACCGSRVHIPHERREAMEPFWRYHQGPVVHLLTVPNDLSDHMPPSRIGDLQIEVLPNSRKQLLATWTSPGDDFDHGSVSGYKIAYSNNITALLEDRGEYETLKDFERPDLAGVRTSYQFEFNRYYTDYYIGFKAYDERGTLGRMSNVVTVFLNTNDIAASANGDEGSGVAGDSDKISSTNDKSLSSDEGVMVGIVCGVFCVIGIMLWAGLWFLKKQRKRDMVSANGHTKRGVNAQLVVGSVGGTNGVGRVGVGPMSGGSGETEVIEHDTTASDCELKPALKKTSDRKPMIPQFSAMASGGPVGSYGPLPQTSPKAEHIPKLNLLDKEDLTTPTYWSASKLLNEHEHRIQSEAIKQHQMEKQQQQQQQQQQGHDRLEGESPPPSTTTFHKNFPKPLDPIVEEDPFLVPVSPTRKSSVPLSGATSTPIKYATLTFPRRGSSVPPSPIRDTLLHNQGLNGSTGHLASDGLYGYAQSEPPAYGHTAPKSKVPPKIPPKPSLSALLGLSGSDLGRDTVDVFLTTPHPQGKGQKKSSLVHMGAATLSNGGTAVRNITHV